MNSPVESCWDITGRQLRTCLELSTSELAQVGMIRISTTQKLTWNWRRSQSSDSQVRASLTRRARFIGPVLLRINHVHTAERCSRPASRQGICTAQMRVCTRGTSEHLRRFHYQMFVDVRDSLWALHSFPSSLCPLQPWVQATLVIALHEFRDKLEEESLASVWDAFAPDEVQVDAVRSFLQRVNRQKGSVCFLQR